MRSKLAAAEFSSSSTDAKDEQDCLSSIAVGRSSWEQWTTKGIGAGKGPQFSLLQLAATAALTWFSAVTVVSPRRAKDRICSICSVLALTPKSSSTVLTASSLRARRASAVLAESQGSTRLSVNTLAMVAFPSLARSWLTQSAVVDDPVVLNDRTCTKP